MKKSFILLLILFSMIFFADISYALCVKVSDANLRSGPGTKYKESWKVFKYMPFKKLSKKGNWYRVKDVDGDKHWIYSKLVTNKFNCAVVKVKKANVRSGPGTSYSKNALSPSFKYESYKVLKTKSSWVNVINEYGEKGWISRKLLWIY